MTVLVVGVSHRSAPTAVLERASIPQPELPKVIAELLGADCIGEAMVLATCNRLEVYAAVSRFHGAVSEIGAILARTASVPVGDLAEHAYVHFAEAANEHLLRVTAGLDSLVVGESQILGQVRAAYALADHEGSVGSELRPLVQTALRTGKRVHSETGIDRAGASVASLGLDRAEGVLGSLAGRTVVVIGAGSMGALAASRAAKRGAADIVVVNRSLDRARRVASSVGGRAAALDDVATMRAEIDAADLVISVTGAAGYVLDTDALAARPDRALVVLDLAMPRDVDPRVGELPGVSYLDLDALRGTGQLVSDEAVAHAERILSEALQRFLDEQQQLAVAPTVTALRARADSVIEAELLRLDGRLPDLDVAARAEVAQAVRRAVEKVLHAPTVRVKELSVGPDGDGYAAALRALFDLDPASVESVAAVRTAPETERRLRSENVTERRLRSENGTSGERR
ncbi:MAG: glutamyl-tRNA reductase [Jatrophihabitans sp.]